MMPVGSRLQGHADVREMTAIRAAERAAHREYRAALKARKRIVRAVAYAAKETRRRAIIDAAAAEVSHAAAARYLVAAVRHAAAQQRQLDKRRKRRDRQRVHDARGGLPLAIRAKRGGCPKLAAAHCRWREIADRINGEKCEGSRSQQRRMRG